MIAAVWVRWEAMVTIASATARTAARMPTFCPNGSDACPVSWWISSSDMNSSYYKRVTRDERFMREALRLACEGESGGEVPVGAVVIVGEEIVGRGSNA